MEIREFTIDLGRWWSIIETKHFHQARGNTVPCGEYATLYDVRDDVLIEISDYNEVDKVMLKAAQEDKNLQEKVAFKVLKDGKVVKEFKGILLDGLLYIYNQQESLS